MDGRGSAQIRISHVGSRVDEAVDMRPVERRLQRLYQGTQHGRHLRSA